ncbi:MAG: PolC-type DNA polymerase III, partial [Christensenellaceae bacterium]|nr:PolC-type DNA polymerase III [Christensenellaceae bacterium]
FPEAAGAVSDVNRGRAPEDKFKLIFGMEAYLVDDAFKVYGGKNRTFDDEFVVFDIETTCKCPMTCRITEIGAVRVKGRKVVEQFQTFVDPEMSIPPEITVLTGITDDMVAGAPKVGEAIRSFWEFAGDACLCAHNAEFDTSFVFSQSRKIGIFPKNDVLDTLRVARTVCRDMRSYKLDRLAKRYNIPLQHHRAVNDARATAEILLKMWEDAEKEGASCLKDLEDMTSLEDYVKSANTYHTVLLVKNKEGLRNLYKLVSYGHLNFFYRRPRIPKSYVEAHREGLIIGAACEQGQVFRSIFMDQSEEEQKRIASFYDYMEIQPLGNNEFLIREGSARDKEDLMEFNRRILALGDALNKPTVATTDCHFLNPRDEYFRRIIMDASGFTDADNQAPLYFRSTDEMLSEFAYLGEERAMEVVVENPQNIAEEVEEIDLFPGNGATIMPEIEGADVDIRNWAYQRIKERYGDPLPELIEKRLERELGSIIRNGFSILYWIAKKLVEKSMEDGYLVGSRGSVGSSLAAYAMGITEVNPLPPHYLCTHCKHVDFGIDDRYFCGVDMPPAKCPNCGADLVADGFNIPFETFLGIDADKVPDIDLNFSGEYQPKAHKFIEQVFGEEYVYRAGTIGTIKEKTARPMVLKYMEKRGLSVTNAEIDRLSRGCSGVKRTTGQHPGGMVIVPKSRDVFEFTPIQKPADKVDGDTVTTHFDFNSMHDILVKLDILGHDNPTIIRMLQDLIGFDPLKIPLNDPKTMSLFCSTDALGIRPEDIRGIDVGTLGIPEFGTKFVRGMLNDTRPTTMEELIRISGLSHGTDVWLGNAQDLIESGTTTLSGAICTRDDIMNYLVKKGVEQRTAFFTMESVRKGKWAKGKEKNQDKQEAAMREANVEEWFIESCRKIKYMFPKAHAVAYVIMSLRIAYCKVHHPKEYYATFFTTKCSDFDASYVLSGKEKIERALDDLDNLGNKASATEKSLGVVLELVLEMFARGIGFLPVDLKKSHAKRFSVEGDNIRLPFMAIPKLGEKAAEMLESEAQKEEFLSVEDLKRRCKISSSVIDVMREMGCLKGLPEKAQLSLFDAF